MGNVPLQNKGTIQERASLALTTMAARKVNKNSSYPSSDAIVALDDLTSMVTNMEAICTTLPNLVVVNFFASIPN
jgi:hypothetical protein